MKIQILLNSETDVAEFIKVTSRYPHDLDIKAGGYEVDAKSLLGVLGTALQRKAELKVHADSMEGLEKISRYIVTG